MEGAFGVTGTFYENRARKVPRRAVSLRKAKRLRLAIASLRLSESDTGATMYPTRVTTVVLGRAAVQLQIGNGKGAARRRPLASINIRSATG